MVRRGERGPGEGGGPARGPRAAGGLPAVVAGVLAILGTSIAAGAAVGPPPPPPAPVRPSPGITPARIVSATLSSDEILLALLPPERLVAVGAFAADPLVSNAAEAARRVPLRVGADPELLVSLEPDVVFTSPFARPEVRDLLRRARIPTLEVGECTTLEHVRRNVRAIGTAVGERAAAELLVVGMDRELAEVRRRVAGAPRPRVLFYNAGGYTMGGGTLTDELLALAGGENAAAGEGITGHAPIAIERALALDADVVLVTRYRADARSRDLVRAPPLTRDPVWRGARAVREGRVHELAARDVMSTSHHASRGALAIARALHPSRFALDEPSPSRSSPDVAPGPTAPEAP